VQAEVLPLKAEQLLLETDFLPLAEATEDKTLLKLYLVEAHIKVLVVLE
jgi:hypothetical protein